MSYTVLFKATTDVTDELLIGTPVTITDDTDGVPVVSLSKAGLNDLVMPCHGIVWESFGADQSGKIAEIGRVSGLDTSAWSPGDTLYVDNAGGLSDTAGEVVQEVATVAFSDATDGEIIVGLKSSDYSLGGPYQPLDDYLTDISDTTPSGSDVLQFDGANWGTIPLTTEHVKVPTMLSGTYEYLDDYINNTQSSGFFEGGELTDSGAGTLNVSAGKGMIRADDDGIGELLQFDWAASNGIVIATDAVTYVFIDYNGGSPEVQTSLSNTNNGRNRFGLGKVFFDGTTIHIVNAGLNISEVPKRIQERINASQGSVIRTSGSLISEPSPLYLAVTAGVGYAGFNKLIINAIDTSAGDTFTYVSLINGNWTQTPGQTVIDVLHYNDVSVAGSESLELLNNNNYGTHYLYMDFDGDLFVVYGQCNCLKLSDAEDEPVPVTGFGLISEFSILIGRIIVEKGAASFDQIQSAFDQPFNVAAVTTHSDLAELVWTDSGHTGGGVVSELAGFDVTGSATLYPRLRTSLDIAGGVYAIDPALAYRNFRFTASSTAVLPLTTNFPNDSLTFFNTVNLSSTITPSGADTIDDGAYAMWIDKVNESVTLYSDGNGHWMRSSKNRTIFGTDGEIDVAYGDGIFEFPRIGIVTNPTLNGTVNINGDLVLSGNNITDVGTVDGIDVSTIPATYLAIDDASSTYLSSSEAATTYLKLDSSNDPMQGALDMGGYNITNIGALLEQEATDADPIFYIKRNAGAGSLDDYFYTQVKQSNVYNTFVSKAGVANFNYDVSIQDGVSAGTIRYFRTCSTTGQTLFGIYTGASGANEPQHLLYGNNYRTSQICRNNGNLGIGPTFTLDDSDYMFGVNGNSLFKGNVDVEKNVNVDGSLTVVGSSSFGDDVDMGDNNITSVGTITSDTISANTTNTYDLGQPGDVWRNLYLGGNINGAIAFSTSGHLYPVASNAYDLGLFANRWNTAYLNNIQLYNGGVAGTSFLDMYTDPTVALPGAGYCRLYTDTGPKLMLAKSTGSTEIMTADGQVTMVGELDMGENDIVNPGTVDGINIANIPSTYLTIDNASSTYLSSSEAATTYLKLDCSNDPLTNDLDLGSNNLNATNVYATNVFASGTLDATGFVDFHSTMDMNGNHVDGIEYLQMNEQGPAPTMNFGVGALWVSSSAPTSLHFVDDQDQDHEIAYVDDLSTLKVYKTADQIVSSSDAHFDDDHLFVNVEANQFYELDMQLRVSSSAAADFDIGFTGPTSYGLNYTLHSSYTNALQTDLTTVPANHLIATDGTATFNIKGWCQTAGTAGTLQFRWCQWASDPNPTALFENSYMKLVKF